MGGGYSIDHSYGSLSIQVEQLKYYSGQQVNGWIYLNLFKPFPSGSMEVMITGKEKTKYVTVSNNRSTSRNRSFIDLNQRHVSVHKDKLEFFNFHYQILSVVPNLFPAGQYSFPFSFLLPQNLAPTFDYSWMQEGHHCHAKIEYKLKAVLKDDVKKKILIDKSPILVDRSPKEMVGFEQVSKYNAQVQGYCSIDKGIMNMTVHCQKNEYVVGEEASIKLEVDCSKMKANVTEITCALVQNIRMGKRGGKEFSNVLSKKVLPGVNIGQVRAGANAFIFSLPIQTLGPYQSSTKGEIIQCEYTLVQLCNVDRCQCCNDDVKTLLNICVVNQSLQPYVFPPTMMQNGWSPQVMAPVIFPSSSNYVMNEEFKKQVTLLKNK